MKSGIAGNHRGLFRVVTGTIFAGSALVLAATPALCGTTTIYTASAYGAKVNVGSTVKLGPIAPATLPGCSTQPISSNTATAASITNGSLINTGVVTSTASSNTTVATGMSTVSGVNLLGGIISADEIKAVSTTTVDSSGVLHSSSAGSVFANLKVLGIPISATPAPNTTIELPLIGSVVLNEQITQTYASKVVLTVNMIHVNVSLSLGGFAAGTQVVVASGTSELKLVKGYGVVGGYAYAPRLTVGPVTVGSLVAETIPCSGTGGAVETDQVASVSIPNLLSTGAVVVTGEGNINHTGASSQATTSVAGVNLLGIATATAVKSVASGVTTDGKTFTFTGANTFTGISVAGHPEITVNVAPNTKIAIANLGTLYINRVQVFANKIRVVPLELVLSATNSLGLGTADLTIGAAEAQLHSPTIP